jgi:hypothetical protein
LKSGIDLPEIITEIDTLLPQLSSFIEQFNNLVNQSGVSVITDSTGNMSIDVPHSMPESTASNVSTRIGIIDRLITTRGQEINDLFQKGLDIESNMKKENPQYQSQLSDKIESFKKLNKSYIH